MNLKITGLHFDITDAVKARIEDKLAKIARHSDNVISVTVTLSVEKVNYKAAAQAIEQENMYAAIDVLADKLDRAILQHKEKQQQH